MKIVKSAGKKVLPQWIRAEIRPVLTFTGAGRALATGSRILVRRGWDALSEHLHGWERIGALAFAGYATVYGCITAPTAASFAIPGAAAAWCVSAWWIAPPATAEHAPDDEPSEAADAFAAWLLQRMEDRPGIHLRDLYPAMRELPGQEDRTDPQLRAALRALRVPVHRSLRIGLVAGRSGVRRDDVAALLPAPETKPVEKHGDAGQSADSPQLSTNGEAL